MINRSFLPIFLLVLNVPTLWGNLLMDAYAGATQGYAAFGTESFDAYRYPAGMGLGFRAVFSEKGPAVGTEISVFGYPQREGTANFGQSWMIHGLVTTGWALPVVPGSGFALIPGLGLGLYHRVLRFNGVDIAQTRLLIRAFIEGLLVTERRTSIGVIFGLNTYLDNRPVVSIDIGVQVGYRFGVSL